MKKIVWMPAACAALFLAGCDEMGTMGQNGQEGFLSPVPEAVAQMAAPYQDMTAVRLEPSTGCFVYRHRGPVETTMLPLRTEDGRAICTAKDEAPAT
ncbi:MAG: hypothetical protein WEB56_02810 [Roseovarius sp.]